MQEVPDVVSTFSKGRSGVPLQNEPVKQPAYVSGTFSRSSNSSRVTDNMSAVTRRKQKLNRLDNKIVATSVATTSPADEEQVVISSNVHISRRFRLYPSKKRSEHKFNGQRLPETAKIEHRLSDNEANNNNLPQADVNYVKLQNSLKSVIGNSLLINETKENKISSLNYLSLRLCGDNTQCEGGRHGTNHVNARKLIKDTDNTGIYKAGRTEDKRQLNVICSRDQENVLNPKSSFSGSSQDATFLKTFGRRMYINRKRYIPESNTGVDRVVGHNRRKRGFHFGYGNEGVHDIPQSASDTADARSRAERPYLINPSFDSLALKKLANLQLRILSERPADTSPELVVSGEYQLDKPQFETIGVNNVPSLLQRLQHEPSAWLSLIRILDTFDRNQVAKHQFDAGKDDRVLRWSQKHLGMHGFNFPHTGYLPDIHPVQIVKRNFDPIGEGVLTGMKQNHVGKRYTALFSRERDFSRNVDFYPVGVYLNPDITPIIRLDTHDNGRDNLQSSYSFQNSYMNYLYGSGTDSASNSHVGETWRNPGPANNFDSVNKWTINATRQHFTENNDMDYIKGSPDGGGNFPEKRLDAISNGALGGIRQNFLDKKHVQTHSTGSLPALFTNFLPNKYSAETGSKVKGDYPQNVVSKLSFNKFTPPRIRWRLNMNYENRKLPRNSKSKLSFPEKRSNDLIFSSPTDQINQKLLQQEEIHDKRVFDSISSSAMNGLRQNYIGQNRLDSNKALSRLNELYFRLLTNRKFPPGGSHFVDGIRNSDINPSTSFKSDDQLRFPNKRDPDIFENVGHKSLEDEEADYEKLYLDSVYRTDNLRSLNRSLTSHPIDKRAPFYTTFVQVEPEADLRLHGSAPPNGRSEENISNLSKELPEKRNFEAIANFSPFSDLTENFIETTKQHQDIGSVPWSRFVKRSWEVHSPAVHEKEDTDNDYKQYLDLLLADFNPRASAEVDKQVGYTKKTRHSDRIRLNSFLTKILESKENILNDLHSKRHLYTFTDDVETLPDFRDRLENYNSKERHQTAEMKEATSRELRK